MNALVLASPFVVYALVELARHDLRAEHLIMIALVIMLARVNDWTRGLLRGLYPLGLVFVSYDAMRPFASVGVTAERVHVCDLRAVEARWFGAGGRTLHDWFRVHHTPAWDVAFAIPYATFIAWCVFGAIVLFRRDPPRMRRFTWAFFGVNLAGFVTYHIVPAAPPWYFHAHGCVVDVATAPSPGPALERVDALLGVRYFQAMYAKSSSVFGAFPSLHCAYPLLLVLIGWERFGAILRVAGIAFVVWMAAAAVYLDHHWVVDVVAGWSFATVGALVARSWTPRRRDEAGRAVAASSPWRVEGRT